MYIQVLSPRTQRHHVASIMSEAVRIQQLPRCPSLVLDRSCSGQSDDLSTRGAQICRDSCPSASPPLTHGSLQEGYHGGKSSPDGTSGPCRQRVGHGLRRRGRRRRRGCRVAGLSGTATGGRRATACCGRLGGAGHDVGDLDAQGAAEGGGEGDRGSLVLLTAGVHDAARDAVNELLLGADALGVGSRAAADLLA